MPLSTDEIAKAEKFLMHMERECKTWRWLSWVMLSFGLVLLAGSMWIFHRTMLLLAEWRSLFPKDLAAPPTWIDLSAVHSSMLMVCVLYPTGLFLLAVGGFAVIAAGVRSWNRKRDALFVSLARGYLEDHQVLLRLQAGSTP